MIGLYQIIVVFSFIGFLIALYITYQKGKAHPVACPVRGHCNAVVQSDYSKFLHVPVEFLGIAYYLFILSSYLLFLIVPDINSQNPLFTFFVLSMSLGAFLFSIYLTFIQAFLIKQFCTWCLVSASICTVIFISAVNGSAFEFIPFLADFRSWIISIHIMGLIFGFGGAIFSDIFFLRFIKDLKIVKDELYVLKTFSQIIWFGLTISIISGIGLYLPDAEGLNQSAKFIAKMIILAVIIINGVGLNLFITPKLTSIPFGKIADIKKGLRGIRKLSFAMGAISIVSWFSVFILGAMHQIPYDLQTIFGSYLLILLVAIITSQIVEYLLNKGKINPSSL